MAVAMSLSRKVQLAVQLGLSLFCFGIIALMIRPAEVGKVFTQADPLALVGMFLLMPFAVLARAWRWGYILRRKGVRVPILTMYKVTFIGMALNLFLPASLGDIARSYYGWRSHGNKEAMLASAIVDKATALFTLCILGIVCALVMGVGRVALVTAAFAVPIALVLLVPNLVPWSWAASLFRKILKKEMNVEKLRDTFKLDMRTLLTCVGISLLGWACTNMMYCCAFWAFAPDVSLWYVFAVAPLINVMRIVPVTVAGLGSADLLIMYLLSRVGISETEAFMGSMAINICLLALPGLIGAILMLTAAKRKDSISDRNIPTD